MGQALALGLVLSNLAGKARLSNLNHFYVEKQRKQHQLYVPHMFRFNSVRRSCPCPEFVAFVTSGIWVSSNWYYRWLCHVKYWMCVVVWSYSQRRFQTALVGSQDCCCPACLLLIVCAVGPQCSPGCVQSCTVGQAALMLQGSVVGSVGAGQGCCRSCSGLLLITGSTCQLQLTRTSKPTLLTFHHQALTSPTEGL